MSVPDKVMKLKDGKILYDDLRNRVNNSAPVIKNTASGAIASFSDGAEGRPIDSLVVNIEPVQDLHGQEAPYPPGGGANLIPLTVDAIKAANGGANTWDGNSKIINEVTYTILTDDAGNVTGINVNGTATATAKLDLGTIHAVSGTMYGIKMFGESDGGRVFGNVNPNFNSSSDWNITRSTTVTADEDKDIAVSYYIMAGNTVNNYLITPFIAIASTVPTAFSPYSNECPITGWTGANVQAARVNLWNPDKLVNRYINTDGTTVSSSLWGLLEVKNVAPGMKFTLSANASSASYPLQIYAYNSTGAKLANVSKSGTGAISCTITVPNGCAYIYANSLTTFSDIQLEVGSTVSPYSPYQDRTIPVSWETEAGTVWNGDVDIISGRLRALCAEVDLGSLTWSKYNTANVIFRATVSGIEEPSTTAERLTGFLCSAYKASTGTDIPTGVSDKSALRNQGFIYIKDTAYADSTASEFATAMSGVQLVYKLAEPVQYQLTPNQLFTLLGQNNIWADCGSIASVEYSADTKNYVDNAAEAPVTDVQINGTSILKNNIANIPVASANNLGVVKFNPGQGITRASDNSIAVNAAVDTNYKYGNDALRPITTANQHKSVFYGLAKVAGSDEKNSTLPTGQYTDSAKSAIHTMLNGSVSVTGTTPIITALPGIRYVCGEVSTLTVNLPASGIVDIVFESGSTATVLTITPPTGVTVKWANGFDPTALDTNTTYEINICDGLGVAVGWT